MSERARVSCPWLRFLMACEDPSFATHSYFVLGLAVARMFGHVSQLPILLSSDDEDLADTPKFEHFTDAARVFQLRDDGDPVRTWALSLQQMLEPACSVTHVLLSTFGHSAAQLHNLCQRLEALCPQITEILLISDWRNTGGVGATKTGPEDAGEGFTSNPFVHHPAAGAFRSRCTVVFPPLAGDEPERSGTAKGRAKHSIQHTKLLLVRHAAASAQHQSGGGATFEAAERAAHLRVHVMSCNVDNVLSHKGKVGDLVWRSPPLEALPNGAMRPELVLPSTASGWRFGSPLFKLLRAMLEPAMEAVRNAEEAVGADGAGARDASKLYEWSNMLALYNLERVPDTIHLVFCMPGCHPGSGHRFCGCNQPNRAGVSLGSLSGEIGVVGCLGGRLETWRSSKSMADNLSAIVQQRERLGLGGPGTPLILQGARACARVIPHEVRLVPDDGNAQDPDTLKVCLHFSETNLEVGRIGRRDAAGLRGLLAARKVEYEATLEIVFRDAPPIPKDPSTHKEGTRVRAEAEETARKRAEQVAERTSSGEIQLPDSLKHAEVYFDITVRRVPGGQRVSPTVWLDLASAIRCNLGLGRLREVLRATGPWPREKKTAFVALSASMGRELKFLGSLASAVDDTPDLDAWPRQRVLDELKLREIPLPEGGRKPATVPMLKEALRPLLQQRSILPSLVLPSAHAAGALMGDQHAFDAFVAHHESMRAGGGGLSLLNQLDLDALPPIGVHPRVKAEMDQGWHAFARRLTHSHSKVLMSIFEEGGRHGQSHLPEANAAAADGAAGPKADAAADGMVGPARFGWLYMGSHNLSATAWGDPWVKWPAASGEGPVMAGADGSPWTPSGPLEMIQFSSWEVGVIITVRPGTPAALAEAQMSFESWPMQFDPCQLVPYEPSDVQSARDSFALLPALDAMQKGDAEWERHIPLDVKQRLQGRLHELWQLWQIMGASGGGWDALGYGYEGADNEDDKADGIEAVAGFCGQAIDVDDALLQAGIEASLMEWRKRPLPAAAADDGSTSASDVAKGVSDNHARQSGSAETERQRNPKRPAPGREASSDVIDLS